MGTLLNKFYNVSNDKSNLKLSLFIVAFLLQVNITSLVHKITNPLLKGF